MFNVIFKKIYIYIFRLINVVWLSIYSASSTCRWIPRACLERRLTAPSVETFLKSM